MNRFMGLLCLVSIPSWALTALHTTMGWLTAAFAAIITAATWSAWPEKPHLYFSVFARGGFPSILSPITKHVAENATVEAKKTVSSRLSWDAGKLGTQRMLIGTYKDRSELTHV